VKRRGTLFGLLTIAIATVGAAAFDNGQRLRADVAVLASDAMMGRDPARPEFDQAARYVASRFDAVGLHPGADGGWFQTVPLVRYRPDGQGSATWAPADTAAKRMTPGLDFYAEGDPVGPARHVSAPVVFVGYGISADGHDDYRGVDVRGKIVAALFGGPGTGDPVERASAWSTSAKREAARARGAIGFINVHIDLPGTASFATAAKAAARYTQTAWATSDGASGAGPAGIPLLATLSENGASMLFGADWRNAVGQTAPGRLTIDTATRIDRIASRNVVGVLPGRDSRLSREVVIVSAHLDHIGVSPGDHGDRINNGALDNAIGVAAIIDIARGLVADGPGPRRTILFLAPTGEEDGLLGSDYFAAHPGRPIDRFVADINVDMPILTYPFEDMIAYGAERSTLGATVRAVAGRFGVVVSPDPAPNHALYVRSDQFSFARRGIPSVMIWPGRKGPGAAATDDFMNSRYHRPADDTGNAIRWDQAARYAAILSALVRDTANADRRPAMTAR